MSKSGITNDMTVIAYGSYPSTGALIFWLLKLFGHQNVRVLNGGYQKWKLENCPLVTELSTFPAVPYSAKAPDASLRVLHQEVQASIGRSEVSGALAIALNLILCKVSLYGKIRQRSARKYTA